MLESRLRIGIMLLRFMLSRDIHKQTRKQEPDYAELAKLNGTLVFLMGLANLSHITTELMKNGMSADMPVAVIQEGTTARQRTVTGTLSIISDLVVQQHIQAPATIVVGESCYTERTSAVV